MPDMRPFDPQEAVFTSLAYWVAERDGITPDQAALNLAALFESQPVQDAAKAEEAAAVVSEAAPAAAAKAAEDIAGILDELRKILGLA